MSADTREDPLDRVRALPDAQPDIQVAIVSGSGAAGASTSHSDSDSLSSPGVRPAYRVEAN